MHDDDDNSNATFDDGLRLALAYYSIMEPEKRAVIKALVEKYADKARLLDAMPQSASVVCESASLESDPIVLARSGLLEVKKLIRQRDYTQHLRTLQFSIVEEGVETLLK